MDEKLVNWTHWYEMFPGYAQKCIILNKCNWPFSGFPRILCDDGDVWKVHQDTLIPMGDYRRGEANASWRN